MAYDPGSRSSTHVSLRQNTRETGSCTWREQQHVAWTMETVACIEKSSSVAMMHTECRIVFFMTLNSDMDVMAASCLHA